MALMWENVCVNTRSGKNILDNVSGYVNKGCALAIMGPSGCGKTTLINCIAQRSTSFTGNISVGENTIINRRLITFVPQEDHLIGALTVRETLLFCAKLSTNMSKIERLARVSELIDAFGLSNQADTVVGTPIQKGISGGQKRRTSVASQLITSPQIVCLDEPTSGLDSLSAYEIISYLCELARRENIIVVASIHQPSTSTFRLFDNVLLLSKGKMIYNGPVACEDYFRQAGCNIPQYYNPADYMLEVTNTDFSHDEHTLKTLIDYWENSREAIVLLDDVVRGVSELSDSTHKPNVFKQTVILVHRLLIKSYRDIVVYGVRLAMYVGLAILMGTVWLRLDTNQDKIQAYINAMFFSSAFLSFMAVAYIPAFLEDRAVLVRERDNGLYGVTSFILSNMIIGIPFLFIIALTFCLITYWLINLKGAFILYLLFLFLDLIVAESLVVLVCSLIPNFVAALAITAFANGLFMSAGGFLVNPSILQPFYYYSFYQFNYQRYVFEGLVRNEFENRVYECDHECHCMYNTDLANKCNISGQGIIDYLGYSQVHIAEWAGILIAVTVVMRLIGWSILFWRAKS